MHLNGTVGRLDVDTLQHRDLEDPQHTPRLAGSLEKDRIFPKVRVNCADSRGPVVELPLDPSR